MIKVKNNIPAREAIPAFLVGLKPESLLDLSWTDPALEVSDAVWWPEEDQSAVLDKYEVYGAEALTLDAVRKVVIVTKSVESMPQAQIDELNAKQAVQVRAARNTKLTACDWTQGKDITDAVSLPWATYRQALRDVPTQSGFPWTHVWPDAP